MSRPSAEMPELEQGGHSSGGGAGAPAASATPPGGRGDCLLVFCRCVNVLAACAALMCLVANLVELGRSKEVPGASSSSSSSSSSTPGGWAGPSELTITQALRVYTCVWAAVCVAVETEYGWVLSWWPALELWCGRGLVQAFVAALTLHLTSPLVAGAPPQLPSFAAYRLAAGLSLLCTAGFYIVGGALCLGVVKQSRRARVEERERVRRDLLELERQREDLERLLASHNR